MKTKKLILASAIAAAVLCWAPASMAIGVRVNGNEVKFTADDGIPFAENGRTLVPLRASAEAYGAIVDYDGARNTAIVQKDGVTVEVPIGESIIYRNGEVIKNDVAAQAKDGRTYLPIRVVMEALGAQVGWDGNTSTVTVEDPDLMFIEEIESLPVAGPAEKWRLWQDAVAAQDGGQYARALDLYRQCATAIMGEGSANAAMVFQHMGECYAALSKYHEAALCYDRSSHYWAMEPTQSETALYYSYMSDFVDTDIELYLKTDDKTYNRTKYFGAPWEPQNGILLGAYAENDPAVSSSGNSKSLYFYGFPELTGKDHGVYLIYFQYGSRVDMYDSHFEEAKKTNSVIELALQPQGGIETVQADYVTKLAQYVENSGCKVLLRFANEMNDETCAWHTTDYNKYIEKFRMVADIFHTYAPSAAMVWAPNFYPSNNIDSYYPGDNYVDYVGLSVYQEYTPDNDPLKQGVERGRWSNILDQVYATYGQRKPIIVSEGGCGYTNIRTGADLTAFSAEQTLDFYTYIPIRYPNLKMMVYYDANETSPAPNCIAPRHFLLSDNSQVLNSYKMGINSSQRYLGSWDEEDHGEYYYELFRNVSLPAKKIQLCSYITSPVRDFDYVAYTVNGVSSAAYALPYTAEIDLSGYSGQSVEILVQAYKNDGTLCAEKTLQVNVE